MNHTAMLLELLGRVGEHVDAAVDGLDDAQLAWTPTDGANPIGWLIWHLTRVQDHHIAELVGDDQLWISGNWASHFAVSADPNNTGYGHSPNDITSIRPDGAAVLRDYYAAVAERTTEFISSLSEFDLDRIVDERWDPPVTLGVRLASILDDDIQHAGQAGYVRGLLEHAAAG